MKKIPVAVAVIVNKYQQILLTKRFNPSDPKTHLRWQLPGGGIEKGETIKDACLRETLEETGLTIKLLTKNPFFIRQHYPGKNFYLQGFLAESISGTINTKADKETADAKWFERSEIGKIETLDNTLEMIEGCLDYGRKINSN